MALYGILLLGLSKNSTRSHRKREFFVELCPLAPSIDRNVRFAGVVDKNGKLLVGEYREDIKSPLFESLQKEGDKQQPLLRKLQVGVVYQDV